MHFSIIFIILPSLLSSSSATIVSTGSSAANNQRPSSINNVNVVNDPVTQLGGKYGCPLCDSSVYQYCTYDKIFHDSCCCNGGSALSNAGFGYPGNPGVPVTQPNCYYEDCRYLWAKSCDEHILITECCCKRP